MLLYPNDDSHDSAYVILYPQLLLFLSFKWMYFPKKVVFLKLEYIIFYLFYLPSLNSYEDTSVLLWAVDSEYMDAH